MPGTPHHGGILNMITQPAKFFNTNISKLTDHLIRLKRSNGSTALPDPFIVFSGVKLVGTVGIANYKLNPVKLKGNQLIFKCIAVQVNSMIFPAHGRSKLIHNSAHHACKFMFSLLRHLNQFYFR